MADSAKNLNDSKLFSFLGFYCNLVHFLKLFVSIRYYCLLNRPYFVFKTLHFVLFFYVVLYSIKNINSDVSDVVGSRFRNGGEGDVPRDPGDEVGLLLNLMLQ